MSGGTRPPDPADLVEPEDLEVEDDDEEIHPVVDALATVGMYVALGSLALAMVGLGAIAADVRPFGDAAVAISITTGTGAMVVAAFVGIANQEVYVPLLEQGEDDED